MSALDRVLALAAPAAPASPLGKLLALADDSEVKPYEKVLRGRVVHVSGYVRGEHGVKHWENRVLGGEEADKALDAGVAIGEYGEKNGNFIDSNGEKHWGWWGGAGALVRNKDEHGVTRYLLQRRGYGVQHGGTWSTPGGAVDRHNGVVETPEQAAVREVEEEFGGKLPADLTHAETRTKSFGEPPYQWQYHTVVLDSPSRFDPEGKGGIKGVHNTAWESAGYAWVTPEEMAKLPLHPAFQPTAEELGMPAGGGKVAPPPPPKFQPKKRPDMPDDYKPGDQVTWLYKGKVTEGTITGPGRGKPGKLPDTYKAKGPDGVEREVEWGKLRLKNAPPPPGGHALPKFAPQPVKVGEFAKGDRITYFGKHGRIIATGKNAHMVKFDDGTTKSVLASSFSLKHEAAAEATGKLLTGNSGKPAALFTPGDRVYSSYHGKNGTVSAVHRDGGLRVSFDDGSGEYFPRSSYDVLSRIIAEPPRPGPAKFTKGDKVVSAGDAGTAEVMYLDKDKTDAKGRKWYALKWPGDKFSPEGYYGFRKEDDLSPG